MNHDNMDHLMTGYALLRLALGLNILLHGWVRWRAGREKFAMALVKEFEGSLLPVGPTRWFGRTLPVAETITGTLLATGCFTSLAIITGTVIMLLLLLGKSIKGDWQTVSLQMIYIAFYGGLELLLPYNQLSIDFLLAKQ